MNDRDQLGCGAENPPRKPGPTVVGIGASAGGLAALKRFFESVHEDIGFAFVVVVHLSAEHESHLADLLQLRVKIPVLQVTRATEILPDNVYVIPPGYNISAIDTHLRLSSIEGRMKERAPIDHFFRTLAATHDGHAIGVILTGTGTDGTQGIREIKAKGGLVIVQDPVEAEYDGMPQSAIATGLADMILPVAEIPPALDRIVRTKPQITFPADEGTAGDQRRLLQKVFSILRARTARDFSPYKQSTSLRRISRRMQLNYVETLEKYIEKLQNSPAEVRALSDDLLITVTNFFRDPEVFDALQTEVIPKLFEGKGSEDSIRVWSVGTATGEEAYSLAMLLLEEADRAETHPPIQIFATDLHAPSLVKAREGFFSADIGSDVNAERLRRFFHEENHGYQIRKEVRDLVVFSVHNLLSDPPFSHMDLIACRNVLIYMQSTVQKNVVELFHYALKPDGYLVLGPSENAQATELFRPVGKAQRVLQKRNVSLSDPHLPAFPWSRSFPGMRTGATNGAVIPSYGAVYSRLLEKVSPPSLLISPDDNIVYLSEHAGRYLVHPGGDHTQNIVKSVRAELRIEMLAALQAARKEHRAVRANPVRVDGEPSAVVLNVFPASEPNENGFLLVSFEEADQAKPDGDKSAPGSADPADGGERIQLQAELDLMRTRLQSVISEYENGQEEMKASNEELQSTNEELRSTMEELETSKEELQSINEELHTMNQENRQKVEELAMLSSDLQNLLAATDIATLFLDREFRILRFTPQLGKLFNIRATDRGRPISDLTHKLGYDALQSDVEAVLINLVPLEREVQDREGCSYLMRVRPYRSPEDRIEGVVVTFIDISTRKAMENALKTSQEQLAQEVEVLTELHRMSLAVVSARDFEKASREIMLTAVQLLRADYSYIGLLEKDGTRVRISSQYGFPAELTELLSRLAESTETPSGQALRKGSRTATADFEVDEAFASCRSMVREAGYRAVQSTPLINSSGNTMGILSTFWRKPHELTQREERILDVLSREASVLLERLEIERELKRITGSLERIVDERTLAVREKERQVRELASETLVTEHATRNRIGQVLHDDLQQLLFSSEMKLNNLTEALKEHRTAPIQPQLEEAHALIRRSIQLTRKLTIELSQEFPEGTGLADVIGGLAEQMKELHSLSVEINMDHDLAASPQLSLLLIEQTRELLFNIVKHAHTQHAAVDLHRNKDEVSLRVVDYGAGFDVNANIDPAKSYGLAHIRHQVALFGGVCEIDSAPGRGTTVTVRIPDRME